MATIVYLDVEDEITIAAARIRRAGQPRVGVVVPFGSRVATSRINFRLLAREAVDAGRLARIAQGDPDAEVRRIAVGALGYAADGGVAQALTRALADGNWIVREEAAQTLGKLRLRPAIAQLVLAMEDPYWQVRLKAARSLGQLKAAEGVEALVATLGHSISNLRKEAAIALGEIGDARALPALEERLDFPIVVKPAAQGSALGVKFARTTADVPAAIVAAFSYDTKVLLERYVEGRDLAVSVIDGPGGPEALPIVEAIPHEEHFYDFEARYEIGRTAFVCPALIPPETTARAQELALATWRTLGCAGFARVDLMAAGDELTVLEANATPGLTDTSLRPLAADAAGIDLDAFVARVLDRAGAAAAA